MGEEIAFENGLISDFQGLVTLTLKLDRAILHSVMHHSSTSTYTQNFIKIEETFCGRMDRRTDGHLRPTLLGPLRGVDLKISPGTGVPGLIRQSTDRNWHLCQLQSHVRRDTKTGSNIKNPARTNLDILPQFKNPWSVASSHCKWRRT